MPVVYVNIGSNIGDRETLLKKAIDELSDRFGCCCISGLVESEPWGFDSANPFLNIGVSFRSDMHPEKILDELQNIEKKISQVAHRNKDGGYADREIDIDIMEIEGLVYESERLLIPHIHLQERDFFLIPLKELKFVKN